jgi:hypothetical protein
MVGLPARSCPSERWRWPRTREFFYEHFCSLSSERWYVPHVYLRARIAAPPRFQNQLLILVVEDDQLVQSVVEDTLSEGGFEAVTASTGEMLSSCLMRPKANTGRLSRTSIWGRERSTGGMSHGTLERSTLTFPLST